MKTFIATIILLASFTISTQAQITKTDIKGQLQDMGLSLGSMKKIFVNNLIVGHNTGKVVRKSKVFELGAKSKLVLTERGIKKVSFENGQISFTTFYPYTSISNYLISRSFITINLKN
ncbi:hypothetical protein BKI52_15675 [marine bacterium AO1-C]|nr:hypothetical protein BKI52_15675 [marine bacterium AO1-C]